MSDQRRVVAKPSSNGEGLVIEIHGALDFHARKAFRQAYEYRGKRFRRYAVNLRDCQRIDSAGLGLLLMMRDHAQRERHDLRLTRCSGEISRALGYVKFDEFFTIIPD